LNTHGKHLLVEYIGCNHAILNNLPKIKELMEQAALAAKTRVVASVFHPFEPQGVSGVVVIEESHLSIHTWPEHGYAAVDFYTCGKGDPEEAHVVIKEGLQAENFERINVKRGHLEDCVIMHINKDKE
jgi:S-adenosylmethionine decarboxylase